MGRTGLAWGEAGSWVVDDGYRPVAGGTYKLDWERDGGLLLISGTSTDPVLRGGNDRHRLRVVRPATLTHPQTTHEPSFPKP